MRPNRASVFLVLDGAEAFNEPVAHYALFSGGHDSLTATALAFDWAEERDIEMWAAHINTGTGVPQTTEFVRATCRDHGWPLRELEPVEEQNYEWLVRRFGFPGPGQHPLAYRYLKERQLDRLVREAKRGHARADRVMLITGVRQEESVRRMAHVEPIQRQGGKLYVAPIWDWTKQNCNTYIDAHGLPRNDD